MNHNEEYNEIPETETPLNAFSMESTPADSAAPIEAAPADSAAPIEAAPADSTAPAEAAPTDSAAPSEAAPTDSAVPSEAAPADSAAAEEPDSSAADGPRPEGEYRFVPGRKDAWADAGYVPVSDAGAMPKSYHCTAEPEKKERTEKKHGKAGKAAGMIAACLVCAMLGGIAGGIVAPRFSSRGEAAAEEPAVTETVNRGGAVSAVAPVSTPQVMTATSGSAAVGKAMSATDIYYNLAVNQTVAITTEITYTNIWGYTTSGAVKGSGFILSEDGYIMTNYHVIEEAVKGGYDIEVLMYDGTEYIAEVVGYAEENDVAVIKIDATGLTPVTFGDSDAMQVGETVYVVGNPTGELEYSMTDGMISATDREVAVRDGSSYRILNLFQTTAAINGGNSGGPVYNSRGEVIGIATAGGDSSVVEALFFAIPINDAASIANDLMKDGYVRGKAFMGIVKPSTLNATSAQYYGIVPGVYFEGVLEGSAAEKAGMQMGDILVGIDDREILTTQDMTDVLNDYHAGDTATIRVYRNSEYVDLTITFDEATPENTKVPAEKTNSNGGQRQNGNGSGSGNGSNGGNSYYDYFYDFFNGNPFGR